MKKNILFGAALCFLLGACAGNPPAWWNPGNAYSVDAPSQRPSSGTMSSGQTAAPAAQQREDIVPREEAIAPLPDESYEEMILTPLQDEETENVSGESSAQSVPSSSAVLPLPSVLE